MFVDWLIFCNCGGNRNHTDYREIFQVNKFLVIKVIGAEMSSEKGLIHLVDCIDIIIG